MADFAFGPAQLNYRVAGVCLHDGRVLLHRLHGEEHWSLPGGRPMRFETARDALTREMREEIGLDVEVGRLLWVNENFFVHAGARFHELGLYFAMSLPADSPLADPRREHIGVELDHRLIFRWFPVDRLSGLPLYPEFLRAALGNLPQQPVHVVERDC